MRHLSVILVACLIQWLPLTRAQVEPDDAVVIESGVGGITPIDGPDGPSIIGSVDNVFKAVKDYDQFRCIEKMICEAMSENTDIPGLDGLVSALTGEPTGPAQSLASTFGGVTGGRPPTAASTAGSGIGSFLGSLEELIFGNRRRSGPISPQRPLRRQPPPLRRRPPPRRRFPANRRRDHLHASDDTFRPSTPIRTKRQTRLQGNIIRLMQATGMDSYNAFPYVRAALIGHATRNTNRFSGNRVTRRGSACAQLFKDCPSDSNSLLDYFNNHNGGLVNQVQPAVDNEVGPIIQAIVADVVSNNRPETAASTAGESDSLIGSDLFQAGDALFTNAIINGATEFFTGSSSASGGSGASDLFGGGLDSIVDSIIGKRKK